MTQILKGAPVVDAMNEKMAAEVATLKKKGVIPTLAILRVGDRADQISYEKGATKRAEAVGVAVQHIALPDEIGQIALMAVVKGLNADKGVHGVLMLHPLPECLSEEEVRQALDPAKDVDGITDGSLAGVFSGLDESFAPCTPTACMEILDHYGIECKGKRAVVVGRSLVVGKPAAMMLMKKNATVTVCHTKTVDLPSITRTADIIIVAAGQAESLTAEYFSPGQTVIDVGIHMNAETHKLCGDVMFDEAEPIVGAISPVPGGVGSVTSSVLVRHVIESALRA
jgi:methylenetetrahydrofolate dehydrogenase (NADP+)/methenyltetrahydrofolate cyclohydrolase